MKNPAIVIPVCYRLSALKRLIYSIEQANIPVSTPLVFSCDQDCNENVLAFLDEFEWEKGPLRVIHHHSKKGLDQNILYCAGLSVEYDAVIILEDDCLVSPGFYHFATGLINHYESDSRIAAYSLYRYHHNENLSVPFNPLNDGYSLFFMQKASTRGQVFTSKQWKRFLSHKTSNNPVRSELPAHMKKWQEHNWEKQFNIYLLDSNRFVTYPYHSFSTNFGEIGEHVKNSAYFRSFQSTLTLANDQNVYKLPAIDETLAVYDCFYELLPEKFLKLIPEAESLNLLNKALVIDLYGQKKLTNSDELVISSQKYEGKAIKSWGRELKPHEFNFKYNISGVFFKLGESRHFRKHKLEISDEVSYYAPWLHFKMVLSYLFSKVLKVAFKKS